MSTSKPMGRVVAELGRPETAKETAARKAQSSRLHRERQTVNNLVFSLLATLGVVVIIVLMVPRNNPGTVGNPVDWKSIAAQGAGVEPDALLSPDLPTGWTANSAQLRQGNADGIDDWHIGFISPSKQYVGLDQGFKANPTWAEDQIDQIRATGSTTINGVHWTVYNNAGGQTDTTDVTYALVASHGQSTVVLSGNAKPSDFDAVARAVAPELEASK